MCINLVKIAKRGKNKQLANRFGLLHASRYAGKRPVVHQHFDSDDGDSYSLSMDEAGAMKLVENIAFQMNSTWDSPAGAYNREDQVANARKWLYSLAASIK